MFKLIVSFSIILSTSNLFATLDHSTQTAAKNFLQALVNYNLTKAKTTPDAFLAKIQKEQNPQATVLSCSDSRVHLENFFQNPTNIVFEVKNIGDQLETALGSIIFGIRYLGTPVLFIMGHTGCGAVIAAIAGYKGSQDRIARELATIFPKGLFEKDGVLKNVDNQVDAALKEFAPEIRDGKLVVIGAIYDLMNTYKKGSQRVVIVRVNQSKNSDDILKQLSSFGAANAAILSR